MWTAPADCCCNPKTIVHTKRQTPGLRCLFFYAPNPGKWGSKREMRMPKALCHSQQTAPQKRYPPKQFSDRRMKTKFMPVSRLKSGQTNRTARLTNRRMRCLLHVPLQPTGGDKAGKQPSRLCRSAHGLWFSLPICLYKRCLPLCFLRSRLYVACLPRGGLSHPLHINTGQVFRCAS